MQNAEIQNTGMQSIETRNIKMRRKLLLMAGVAI